MNDVKLNSNKTIIKPWRLEMKPRKKLVCVVSLLIAVAISVVVLLS